MRTKKIFIGYILILFITTFLGEYIITKVLPLSSPKPREFEIRGGLSQGWDNYEICHSHVLVNKRRYDEDEMFTKVKEEYIRLNGTPNELTIYLYNSKKSFESGEYDTSRYYILQDSGELKEAK